MGNFQFHTHVDIYETSVLDKITDNSFAIKTELSGSQYILWTYSYSKYWHKILASSFKNNNDDMSLNGHRKQNLRLTGEKTKALAFEDAFTCTRKL